MTIMAQEKLTFKQSVMEHLSELMTDDFQSGASFAGEPLSIAISLLNADEVRILMRFVCTDEDIAIEWFDEFVSENHLPQQYDYNYVNLDDDMSQLTVCFSKATWQDKYDISDDVDDDIPDISQTKEDDMPINGKADIEETVESQPAMIMTDSSSTQTNVNLVQTQTTSEDAQPNTRISFLDVNPQGADKPLSAYKQIVALIHQCMHKMTPAHLQQLCDVDFCKKNASLAYAMFLKVDASKAYKDQTRFNGKSRYARHPINIQGDDYYITNHLFKRNVDKSKQMFIVMGLI